MTKPSSLVQLLYAVEAAGYATAGICQTSAEWDTAVLSRQRTRSRTALTPVVAVVGSRLTRVFLAALFVMIR